MYDFRYTIVIYKYVHNYKEKIIHVLNICRLYMYNLELFQKNTWHLHMRHWRDIAMISRRYLKPYWRTSMPMKKSASYEALCQSCIELPVRLSRCLFINWDHIMNSWWGSASRRWILTPWLVCFELCEILPQWEHSHCSFKLCPVENAERRKM